MSNLKFILLISFISINLSSPFCKENQNYCTKCNPITNICINCSPKEIFIPDTEGGCICNKNCIAGYNYCKECDTSSNCQKCETGYYPDEIGGCSYTENCKYSLRGECLICKEDFILIGDTIKLCKYKYSEDLLNCEEINYKTGLCENCDNNYYKNSKDNKCTKTENCASSLLGMCKKCNTEYYLNKIEEKCIKETEKFQHCKETIDGYNCEECDDDYFLSLDGYCSKINFCLINNINNDFSCTQCISGYFLTKNGNVCTQEENCLEGEKITGNCISCIDNFYLNTNLGKCFSNKENNEFKFCKKAFSDICTECISGYFLGEDNKCSTTTKCVYSENGECNFCKEGFFLDDAKKCNDVENCKYSSPSYPSYTCKECYENYYYNVASNKCLLADDRKFENCLKTNYDGKTCFECRKNYFISTQNNYCYSNMEEGPFYKCLKGDTNLNICIVCESEYYLGSEDDLCTKIMNCAISENENKCTKCDDDYCLNVKNGTCISNSEVPVDKNKLIYYNCKKTNENGNACEICENPYILINGYCFNNEKCEVYEKGICQKCLNIGNNYCLNKDFGCVETYVSNCLKCDDSLDFDSCTECMEGYILDEYNECVSV